MSPRALFFPSYFGGGFGHISRCLALSLALQDRGWHTAFAMAGPHSERVRHQVERVFLLDQPYRPDSRSSNANGQSPTFTVFGGMDYQLVRDGLSSPHAIRAALAEQLAVVRRFRPDVLIADAWPLASIVAHLAGLPVVQLIRSILHPAGSQLFWWRPPPSELTPPDPRSLFNPLLARWGLPSILRAEDLLNGDLYLAPSLPAFDPLPPGLQPVVYTGPLVRPPSSELPTWWTELDPQRPLIYATTGGGAASVGGRPFYRLLIEALAAETGWQVVLSTGARLDPHDLPSVPSHIRLLPWAPGPALIARSNLVIYAGGYSTTLELIRAGTPALAIPFHSEQESNARRLLAGGAARLLFPAQDPPQVLEHRWPGGRFTTLAYHHSALTVPELRRQIAACLADADLHSAAKRLQSQAAGYTGALQASEAVEALTASRRSPERAGWDRLPWAQRLSLWRSAA